MTLPETQRVRAGEIEIAYDTFGDPDAPPMVLIMGLASQLVHWKIDFCQLLVDQGFRVIRFDNRDVGESTWFDDRRAPDMRKAMVRRYAGMSIDAPYTLSDMAADTSAFIEALGYESVHVAGVSMGGMIAQTLAIEHAARVRSMASIMSSTGSRRVGFAKPKALKALLQPAPEDREGRIRRGVSVFRTINGDKYPYDEEEAYALIATAYDRGYHPAGFLRQLAAIFASGSRQKALADVRCPTVVIHGTNDPLVHRSGGKATARAIPGARLTWVEGMGHTLPRQAWPVIIDAIVDNARRAGHPA